MILLLDNYDSFTFNLLHYIEQVTDEIVEVKRNNELTLSEIQHYSSIVLSPGPGLPYQAGLMNDVIKKYYSEKPILGICLGHQAIGEFFGGKLINLDHVLHGVKRKINITKYNDRLFKGFSSTFYSGHYHSWIVTEKNLSEDIEITANDDDGNIMAISHKYFPISGVQFHPESVMTENGLLLMKNWNEYCKKLLVSG